MNQPRETPRRGPDLGEFRVGEWSVRPSEGTLCSNDRTVRLEPRVMDVLVYLAANPHRVVPKEELMETVWGGAFVEEGALSQAVHSLRKALGDDARHPRYLQTLPKRGYRLLAPVVAQAAEGEARENDADDVPPPPPPPAARAPVRPARWHWLLPMAAAAFGAAIVLWLGVARLGLKERATQDDPPAAAGMRIVVLPFENLGRPEVGHFADGLTEEITKDLASLPSLQVISRSSALRYRKDRDPLAEIGRALGVQYVLQGKVQWEPEPGAGRQPQARVYAELVRVEDGTIAWSNSFTTEVEHLFEVQAEISRRVIGQLGITLLPEQERELRRRPPVNTEAYQAYLRGLELRSQPFYSEKDVATAMTMFERAVELDEEFAEAWAELSQTHSYLVFNSNPAGREEVARQALETARALAPDLPATRLAEAYYTYRCRQDFEAAYRQLTEAARLSPNDAEVLQTLGFVLRRRGDLHGAIRQLRRAYALDPLTVKLVWAIAETYRALRDYEQADRHYKLAIAMAPDQPYYWEERALTRLAATGDLEAARAVVAKSPVRGQPGMAPIQFQLDFYEREYESALERLAPERLQGLMLADQSRLAALAAVARERLGDRRGALAAAEANLRDLEARVARFPRNGHHRGYLALTLAQLGRQAEALTQAEQAVRLTQGDFFTGPRIVQIQAMVDAALGRRREAVDRLAWLLARPYQAAISVTDLRLNPVWDPLREDPGFEELIRRYDALP